MRGRWLQHNDGSGATGRARTGQRGDFTGSSIAPPTSVQETNTNGSATVSWQPSVAGVTVTGYRVSLIPTYTDRVPAPNLEPNGGVVSDLLPATARTTFSGLLEDCHQRYEISVQTVTACGGLSSAVATQSFRPSGNVAQGQAPPYVVVLVDGDPSHHRVFP